MVIHDISKQIKQRARIGKIFACWDLIVCFTLCTSSEKKKQTKSNLRVSKVLEKGRHNRVLIERRSRVSVTY